MILILQSLLDLNGEIDHSGDVFICDISSNFKHETVSLKVLEDGLFVNIK